MSEKRIAFENIQKEYCSFIDSCIKFNYFTRSKEIQQTKVEECKEFIQIIKSYKSQAIKKGTEQEANQIFHFQCMVNAARSSLLMWIELKEEKFNESWSRLIDAQEYIAIALKVSDYEGVRNFERQLNNIEKAIFPGWTYYNSSGFVETIGKCSICQQSFSSCNHIENNIYMGRLCQRIDRKLLSVDHCAIVENPRDKRCIITKISKDNGSEIDYFTWEKTGKQTDNTEGMHCESVMFCVPSLDVF